LNERVKALELRLEKQEKRKRPKEEQEINLLKDRIRAMEIEIRIFKILFARKIGGYPGELLEVYWQLSKDPEYKSYFNLLFREG
jgi:hypothetical protein